MDYDPIYASWVSEMTGVCHHINRLFVEMGSLKLVAQIGLEP
jgi:hypothetical protein